MKRQLLSFAAIYCLGMGISAFAQENITPEGLKFAKAQDGTAVPFLIKGGANIPYPVADIEGLYGQNNHLLFLGNPNVTDEMMAMFSTGSSVVNLGGEVGNVWAIKGIGNESAWGTPMEDNFNLGWFTLGIFSNPANTPNVADYTNGGMSEDDAKKEATIRVKLVCHIHQNEVSTTSEFIKVYANTYTNNQLLKDPSIILRSGDFASLEFDEETEEEVITYDPTVWIEHEFDVVIPEAAGSPMWIKLGMGGGMANSAVYFKEVNFTRNPVGEPVAKKVVKLTAGDGTALNTVKENHIRYSAANGSLQLMNVPVGTPVSVYNVSGKMVANKIAAENNVQVSLESGIYIVKAGAETIKVVL